MDGSMRDYTGSYSRGGFAGITNPPSGVLPTPPDTIEEFKVQSASFDAATGFMGGASLNMSLKSGTNSVHGQVYYFMQNPVFIADKYFRLAAGKPQFRPYRWGGSVSGPLMIPKLYNGRNRTFFMYGYEGIWSFDPSPWVVESVPTAAMRIRGTCSASP